MWGAIIVPKLRAFILFDSTLSVTLWRSWRSWCSISAFSLGKRRTSIWRPRTCLCGRFHSAKYKMMSMVLKWLNRLTYLQDCSEEDRMLQQAKVHSCQQEGSLKQLPLHARNMLQSPKVGLFPLCSSLWQASSAHVAVWFFHCAERVPPDSNLMVEIKIQWAHKSEMNTWCHLQLRPV